MPVREGRSKSIVDSFLSKLGKLRGENIQVRRVPARRKRGSYSAFLKRKASLSYTGNLSHEKEWAMRTTIILYAEGDQQGARVICFNGEKERLLESLETPKKTWRPSASEEGHLPSFLRSDSCTDFLWRTEIKERKRLQQEPRR